MKHKIQKTAVIFLSSALLILFSSTAHSEFYEYTDKNGVKSYTDDPGRIPDKNRPHAQSHAEKYDGLTESEKAERMKDDHDAVAEIKIKQALDSKKHEKWLKKTEREERKDKRAEKERLREEEKKKKQEEARKKREEKLKKRDDTITRGRFLKYPHN